MSKDATRRFGWLAAVTVFLGAFLLFQVQPVISKMILPWFGGGPAVWTTCLLFFQVLLLAGYSYAHFLSFATNPRWRLLIHLSILLIASISLPITPGDNWRPADGSQPSLRILLLLLAHVGLPYFILASTGPLVQSWYGRVNTSDATYRLYALSNVASLGALLSYPFLVEPLLTTDTQGWVWSASFVIFAFLYGGLAIAEYRLAKQAVAVSDIRAESDPRLVSNTSIGVTHRLAWLILPAIATTMLLAITNHLCQDIAVVPFFWIVPLSVYLISFIICFDRPRWYFRRTFAVLTAVLIVGTSLFVEAPGANRIVDRIGLTQQLTHWNLQFDLSLSVLTESVVYLVLLFVVCMVCHGELVRLKPPIRHLTSFYLMLSAGGALGGLFVALICPLVFRSFLEFGIGLAATTAVVCCVLIEAFRRTLFLNRRWKMSLASLLGAAFVILVFDAQRKPFSPGDTPLLSTRNFYGVLTVLEQESAGAPDWRSRELLNGRILHGSQFTHPDKRSLPTTYYTEQSGIGIALSRFRMDQPRRLAVVGLGAGTLASYARAHDYICFYELNPAAFHLATSHFSFLRDAETRGAEVRVVLGDARISLDRETPQKYDAIALDAFSGDAIPVHLLTTEAFHVYLRHLRQDGILAVHISNRHLDLGPIVDTLAREHQLTSLRFEHTFARALGDTQSTWLLLTKNNDFLREDEIIAKSWPMLQASNVPLWTDQYTNLLQCTRKPRWLEQLLVSSNE